MKKLIALLLALVMVLGLAACNSDTPANTTAGTDNTTQGGGDSTPSRPAFP